jgi:dihydropteroate synthase
MTTNEDIEQAKEGLRLQRFWPHVEDIVIDAGRALAAIEELQARYDMMTKLANVAVDVSANHTDELLKRIEELEQRNRALEVTVDRMTSKDDWEILIDMQRDQLKVRKAFKKVIKQLDDLVKDVA